jgi:hypothetical protein
MAVSSPFIIGRGTVCVGVSSVNKRVAVALRSVKAGVSALSSACEKRVGERARVRHVHPRWPHQSTSGPQHQRCEAYGCMRGVPAAEVLATGGDVRRTGKLQSRENKLGYEMLTHLQTKLLLLQRRQVRHVRGARRHECRRSGGFLMMHHGCGVPPYRCKHPLRPSRSKLSHPIEQSSLNVTDSISPHVR